MNVDKQKIIKMAAMVLLLILFVYLIFSKFIAKKPKKIPAPPAQITASTSANNVRNSSNKNDNGTPKNSSNTSNPAISRQGNMDQNPFVSMNELHNASRKDNAPAPSTNPNEGLPAIPRAEYSAPPVGSVPIPSIPSYDGEDSMGGSGMPRGKSNSVKGVFMGKSGNNMAIMSDGSIVSEGDTYQDGRIAYIGGDGIHFDDGRQIKYGE